MQVCPSLMVCHALFRFACYIVDVLRAQGRARPSAAWAATHLAATCSAFSAQVSWDDIGGLEDVKQRLKEAVELPFREPEALDRLGVVPPRGERV